MGQYTRYTGLLNDGHTVKVELGANGAATATVIDMETPQQIPGNVAIDANKNMTFTSANNGATLVYKAQLKNGGQSMKFVEASGALADAVTGVDLNAVQVVDNYEQSFFNFSIRLAISLLFFISFSIFSTECITVE